jgi:hypothetical protein
VARQPPTDDEYAAILEAAELSGIRGDEVALVIEAGHGRWVASASFDDLEAALAHQRRISERSYVIDGWASRRVI